MSIAVTPASDPPTTPVAPAADPPTTPVTPASDPPTTPVTPAPDPSPPPPPPSTPPASPPSGHSWSAGAIAGICVGAVAIVLVFSILFILYMKKKKKNNKNERGRDDGQGPEDKTKGGNPGDWQNNASPPSNHMISLMRELQPSPPAPTRPLLQSPHIVSRSSVPGSNSNNLGGENSVPVVPSPGNAYGFSKSSFTYEELAGATNGFSDANFLGQGGFGHVHRGLLPDGTEVAVKQLKAGGSQGEREFQAEVDIITRVHHRHLVSLVGYCITGTQRMLVYEFVPNNTLEFHLHEKGRPTMDWPARLRIALGAAKGLAYLHEDCHPKIIHRDVKASNILLDFKFEVKVADFGLARFCSDVDTHLSTRVMGTLGYLAPEYALSGKLTDKSDVFSFGVVLLELISGRRPVDSGHTSTVDSLVEWAMPLLTRALEDENFDILVDLRLQNEYDPNEMVRMVACAAASIRYAAKLRPRMSQIVRALEGEASLADLIGGIRSGHSAVSTYGSLDYDTAQYKEDMTTFRKMVLGTKQYGGSSEVSGPTSEYGVNPSESSSGESQRRRSTREIEINKTKNSHGFSGSS